MKKISVIVPVYNTVSYLEKCLKSICRQTYQNLEIICVDDGSFDGSEDVVDTFAKADARVIAIHQKNQGESAARNTGLASATGEYVAFVDCDDWLEPDMYERMAAALEKWHADLAACGYFLEYDSQSLAAENEWKIPKGPFGRRELFRYVYIRDRYRGVTSWIWCKLFKRERIEQSGPAIRFDETIRFGADLLFFLSYAARVETACYVETPFYHYRQRDTSTSHTKDLSVAFEIVEVYRQMIRFCEKEKVEPEIVPWLQRFLVYRASLVAEQAYRQRDSAMLASCKNVMREFETIYLHTNREWPDRQRRYQEIMDYRLQEAEG